MEFGPAEIVGAVISALVVTMWTINKVQDRLGWGSNGNGKQAQTMLLREIRDILAQHMAEQKADHRIMINSLDRIDRNK